MKLISIVTPCYNEAGNVSELAVRVRKIMEQELFRYAYEHIFIDNASTDSTVSELRKLTSSDKRIKVIINSRNFGHMRSPVYGMLQAKGDAVLSIVSDLQDPPEMIPEFIREWENGHEVVLAIKKDSEEHGLMFKVRELYYGTLSRLSEIEIFKNYTGFGLYDKKVMDALRTMNDPYPFFRGMIAEVGFRVVKLEYNQPVRIKGVTKNNFYTLYDIGMLGIINNSKVPLRMVIFMGVILGVLSLLTAAGYFVAKLFYWDEMSLGLAPLVIGLFFMFSILLFFIGLIGEYIGAIYTQVMARPLVFEQERINFDKE
jgi:polyisoprenyl-phosphate glycosyltransferase